MTTINLVAHYLKENGFSETLKALELEYGQPINSKHENLPNKETLHEIVSDRFNFKSVENELEKVDNSKFKPWKSPYPKKQELQKHLDEVIVSVEIIKSHKLIILSTAKQRLIVVDFDGEIVSIFDQLIGRVVIKKVVSDQKRHLYLAGMNGMLYKFEFNKDFTGLGKVHEMALHRRLIVDLQLISIESVDYLFSLGFDKTIKSIRLDTLEVQTFDILLVPTCFDVVNYKGNIMILIGYNEHTLLDMIKYQDDGFKRVYKVSVNDAEFTTANFSPRVIRFQPMDELYVAIGTSHEPYMRVIILTVSEFNVTDDIKRNHIVKNILTMSPQDKFSSPMISWRPDGDGIWVLGDDGKIRGINLQNNNVIELDTHDGKVKYGVSFEIESEKLLTVGDDKVVKIWGIE